MRKNSSILSDQKFLNKSQNHEFRNLKNIRKKVGKIYSNSEFIPFLNERDHLGKLITQKEKLIIKNNIKKLKTEETKENLIYFKRKYKNKNSYKQNNQKRSLSNFNLENYSKKNYLNFYSKPLHRFETNELSKKNKKLNKLNFQTKNLLNDAKKNLKNFFTNIKENYNNLNTTRKFKKHSLALVKKKPTINCYVSNFTIKECPKKIRNKKKSVSNLSIFKILDTYNEDYTNS